MSEKEQPKKNKPDDEPSEHSSDPSDDTPKDELSPGDDEDKCLLSPLPVGAEVSPVEGGSVASSSKDGKKVTGLMKRCNPFRSKNPKKRKLSSPFSKAKAVLKKTFRKSDTSIQTSKPESERHPRKISDPTDYRKVDLQRGSEPEEGLSHSASTSKETETEDDEQTSKEPKSRGFFRHFYSSSKEVTLKPEGKKKAEAEAAPAVQKKPLSPKISKESSSSDALSIGFFNEGMLPSESSGVPTESTSIDTQDGKSGSSVSPVSSTKKPSTKLSKTEEDDNESSLSE